MTSTIDPTVPANDAALNSSAVRANFAAAKSDIETLQNTVVSNVVTLNGGQTITGQKNMPGGVTGLPAPTVSTDAARKQELDALTAAVATGGTNKTYASVSAAQADGGLANASYYQVVPSAFGGASDIYIKNSSSSSTYQSTIDSATRALAAELLLQTGKAPFVLPLSAEVNANAVRRRFNSSGIVPAPHGSSDVNTIVSYVPNATIAAKYGEPNTLQASINRTVSADPFFPTAGFVITPDDLAKRGIVAGSGTTVDIMGAIDHSSLVNQTAANLQIFIFLRYAGASGSLNPNYNPATDVVFQTANTVTGLGTPGVWGTMAGSALAGDSNLSGWVVQSCPLPASNSGQAFTCIGIIAYGYQAADGLTSMQVCRAQVVPGGTIDTTKSYFNSEDLAQYPVAPNLTHEVSALTADKIAVCSNSYSAGFPNLPGKAVWPRVSSLVDWNIENFSQSGNTFADINARYLRGDLTFGPYSLQQYQARYWWLQEFQNSQAYMSLPSWRMDIATMCQNARSCGAVAILATDLYPSAGGADNWGYGIALTAAAAEEGALFCNTVPNSLKVDVPSNQHAEYFSGGHPGTRTHGILSAPIAAYIRTNLGRPETGFKVYRLRPGVSGSVADNLLFDTKVQLLNSWKEIMIGHWALDSDSYQNFDRLVSGSPLTTVEVPSEYLLLAQGKTPLASSTQWLFRAILNAVPKNVKAAWLEVTGTGTIDSVWVRSTVAAPIMSMTRTQVFQPNPPSITVNVGDTYTSSDSYFGSQVFTVAPGFGANLVMTPTFSGSTTRGSGTLTRQSGTGQSSIPYSSTVAGWDAEYYYDQLKPAGHWVQVPLINGRYVLADITSYMNGDEIAFRVVSSGGFQLQTAKVHWVGKEGKPPAPPVRPVPAVRANGTQMIAQPLCGTSGQVASWSGSSGVTPGVATDGYLTRNASGRVIVTSSNYLQQDTITYTSSDTDRWCDVYAICRNFPADFNPSGHTFPTDSAITLDTADILTCQLDLFVHCDDSTVQGPMSYRDGITLHGEMVIWRTLIPAFTTKLTLKVSCPDGSLEVYEAGMIAVDTL